jgi:succinyl-diaminopimelate desuccinylase
MTDGSAASGPCLALTSELIACASITPDDAGCQQILAKRLSAAGFTVHHLRFNQTDNLWAVHGAAGPLLALVGHTDVVPTGPLEQWSSPPFEPVQRDGQLYGRGAADMKASVAAMCLAAERFVAAHPQHPGRIGYLMTSDEEGPATDGVKRVVQWLVERGERIDHALIGEPSSSSVLGDRIRHGRRGSLHGTLRVQGIQGHVAYPDQARNPVHQFGPALVDLVATRFDEGNVAFPPTSFQIYDIKAGTGANNVIPGVLEVRFNFRFGTASTPASLEAKVREVLDRHALNYDLQMRLSSESFLTAGGRLLEAVESSVADVLGVQTARDTGGGTSDGRFIAPGGAEVVELGPINATIHKIDECVPLACLEPLVDVYEQIIQRTLLQSVGADPAGS